MWREISVLNSDEDAQKLMHEVDEAVLNLETFPELGKRRDMPREDIRVLWVKGYRLTYILDFEQDEILVISFMSGRRKGDALD